MTVPEQEHRTLLEVDDLVARHGLLEAVRGVSFTVAEGEILAVVGANGAGKSTMLRAIAGAHQASAGTIRFGGADLTRYRHAEQARYV